MYRPVFTRRKLHTHTHTQRVMRVVFWSVGMYHWISKIRQSLQGINPTVFLCPKQKKKS